MFWFYLSTVQAPIFMSFFFGLRKMADAPVESMKEGGALWFPDLTVPDPLFILPTITAVSLAVIIELGVDSGMSPGQMQNMKYVMRAMPVITFFLTSGITSWTPAFPTAVLIYWATSNVISTAQAGLLRIPAVRERLDIPQRVKHNPDDLPMKKKTMRQSFDDCESGNIFLEFLHHSKLLDFFKGMRRAVRIT